MRELQYEVRHELEYELQYCDRAACRPPSSFPEKH
jgi:hypothetical protein